LYSERLGATPFFLGEAREPLFERPRVDSLDLKGTDFFFAFDHGAEGTWVGIFAPAPDQMVGKTPPVHWGALGGWFRKWLNDLQIQVTAPDLWGALEHEAKLVAGFGQDQGENDSFTPDEVKQLSERVEEIRRYLLESGAANASKTATINRKLDYLIDALPRLGRFDWKQAAFGIFVQLGIEVLNHSHSIAQFVGVAVGFLSGSAPHGILG
jgi:hypothetical protein